MFLAQAIELPSIFFQQIEFWDHREKPQPSLLIYVCESKKKNDKQFQKVVFLQPLDWRVCVLANNELHLNKQANQKEVLNLHEDIYKYQKFYPPKLQYKDPPLLLQVQ